MGWPTTAASWPETAVLTGGEQPAPAACARDGARKACARGWRWRPSRARAASLAARAVAARGKCRARAHPPPPSRKQRTMPSGIYTVTRAVKPTGALLAVRPRPTPSPTATATMTAAKSAETTYTRERAAPPADAAAAGSTGTNKAAGAAALADIVSGMACAAVSGRPVVRASLFPDSPTTTFRAALLSGRVVVQRKGREISLAKCPQWRGDCDKESIVGGVHMSRRRRAA